MRAEIAGVGSCASAYRAFVAGSPAAIPSALGDVFSPFPIDRLPSVAGDQRTARMRVTR